MDTTICDACSRTAPGRCTHPSCPEGTAHEPVLDLDDEESAAVEAREFGADDAAVWLRLHEALRGLGAENDNSTAEEVRTA